MNYILPQKRKLAALLAASLISTSLAAHSEERADLEQMRSTTMSLIDALVDSGVLSRQKADKLIGDAEAKAAVRSAAASAPAAIAEAAPGPELGKDGKKIVRVPYVSAAVKNEMREQIKQEVLAQSKTERWGEPGALPEWLNRFTFAGDVRMRYEKTKLSPSNSAPGSGGGLGSEFYDASNGLTRAADILGNSANDGKPTFNTQNDRDRWRIRARLGVNARISDMVSAGMSFTTGNTTDRVSTNQTLGQNFNKYSVVLDRAFIKLDPAEWLSFSVGRIANPYFGTDLVWDEDLNFEGVALSLKPKLSPTVNTFLTAGWFPLRENSPGKTTARDLIGVQAGIDWKLTPTTQFKLGAALYEYRNIEGQMETPEAFDSASDYAVRYEYPEGFRQRGNSLFIVNAFPLDPNVNWGLASKFRELNVTGSLDLAQSGPMHVIVTGDYVKNLGFDRDEIASRTGFKIEDGKDLGYLAKVQVGHPKMSARGDWNVSLAYRYLGSDAVLDAFTDSDFGLGGTNTKGTIVGFNYGIDKNSWVTARWLSSDVIDPMVPKLSNTSPSTKLSVDTFQLDLNARF